MEKKTFKKIIAACFIFIIPSILVYLFWLFNGKITNNSDYIIGFSNISMMKIFINNTIICLIMVVSGKYFKVFSSIVFFYNAVLFSFYFLISLENYGSEFIFYKLIYYAPFEIFAISYSLVLSKKINEISKQTIHFNIFIIELFLLIASCLETLVIHGIL